MKKLIVLFALFIALIALTENSLSDVTNDYRSIATGNWSATASWQRYNGSSWVAASAAPTSSTANVITIQSPHIITVNADVTVDQVVVNSGGTLSVSGAVLTIADGNGTDMSVSGTLSLGATTGGNITTTGTLQFESGGLYKHYYNGGAIPTATWNASSTCEIDGLLTSGLDYSSTVQLFGNVTWNCTSWTAGTQPVRFEHIQGNLTVTAGAIDLWYSTAGKSLTIDGNLIINGGTLNLGFSDNLGATAVNLNGDLNLYSGSLTRTYASGSVTFNFSKSGTQNLNIQSSIITGTYINWAIASSSTVNMGSSVSDWTVSTSRTLTLSGTLDCNSPTRYVVGGGNFTSAGSSTLVIRNQDGIYTTGATGQIQVTGTRTFNASANYLFSGDISSFSGGAALVSASEITINNSSVGTLNLDVDLTVNGNIYLNSGWINIGNHVLTLGSSATLHEDASNIVTTTLSGKLVTSRNINNETANLGGLGFIITTAANMGSTTIERHHTAVTGGNHAINRYYKVTPTNNSGLNATVVFSYNQYEVNSIPQNSLKLYKSSDLSTWSQVTPFTRQNSAYTVTATGVGSMSYWTLGDGTPPLPVELTSFNAAVLGSSVCLHWQSATEVNNYGFEIERRAVSCSQSSTDSWIKVGFVSGNGTSNAPKEYSYSDTKLSVGRYAYRLKQIDNDGTFKYSQNVEVEVGTVPKEFTLGQNYPNPFNPSTTIEFTLAKDGFTTLKVYDILGKEVETLVHENLQAGMLHQATFSSSKLSSGMYFYRLECGKQTQVKKLLLMK